MLLKKIFFIIVIICTTGVYLTAEDSIKIWSKNCLLRQSDFQSEIKPESNSNYIGTDEKAIIANSIRVHISQVDTNFNICVLPYMNRKKSWVCSYDSLQMILAHEQIHFNITELIARKLRREILLLQNKGITDISVFSSVINSFVNDSLSYYQTDFDKRTLNGNILSEQNVFKEFIYFELKRYEAFSTDLYTFSDEVIYEIFNSENVYKSVEKASYLFNSK
jgi:hypothetical protein